MKSITNLAVRTKPLLVLGFTIILITSMNIISYAQNEPVLKNVFKNDFLIGAAVNRWQISGEDTIGDEIIKTQFNSITPENVLKWGPVHPKPGIYNFKPADEYVAFGEKNHMFIIGHTLVWHSQTPKWVFEDSSGNPLTRAELLQRMHDHIQTLVGRYKGKIKGWDVVNEALNEDGSLRQSPWMKIIGEDYIEKAFEYAHEADPDAELYYNDYSLENKPKRDGAIKLINKLKSEGIHISGIGDQMHAKMDWPSISQIDSTFSDFEKLGIKVMITELDIDALPYQHENHTAEVSLRFQNNPKLNPYKNGLPDSVNLEIANRYAGFFKTFVKYKSVISRVTFWGVRNSDSWLNNWPVPGRTNYPLPFDRSGKPNLSFQKIIETAETN
ncbi:MAG: endo-1,4-beta-xylanase [Ignavibacteriaceae bacterium]